MSETQALETDKEIDITKEAIELEKKPDVIEEGEIEIIVEEGEQPAPRRLTGFEKRLRKKSEQVSQAESKANALEEENKLLRLAQQQAMAPAKLKEPDEDSFDSDAEYRVAKSAYDDQRINEAVATKTQELFKQSQKNNTQANQSQLEEKSISEHYIRADALKVKNYDELESKAIDALGEDFVKAIIANTDNSHLILPYLGANPGKAYEIAQLKETNPVRAFAKAVSIGSRELTRPKRLTPDPETAVDPGSVASSAKPGLAGVKFE